MTKQSLVESYNEIEKKRIVLKSLYHHLKNINADKKQIKEVGEKLTTLTLNQGWILVDLENYKDDEL